MPPELSAPSLSSTTAPMGRSAVFARQLLQAVADARGGGRRRCLEIVEFRHAGDLPVEAVDASEISFAARSSTPPSSALTACSSRVAPSLGDGHAARIVHQHGDDVLLRLKFGDQDSRLPQQQQHQRGQRELQQPDHARAPVFYRCGCLWQASSGSATPARGAAATQKNEHPLRPGAEQDEVAFRKDGARIFEKKFKHIDFVGSDFRVAQTEVCATKLPVRRAPRNYIQTSNSPDC